MERFRSLIVNCNDFSHAKELLDKIIETCNIQYFIYDKNIEKKYVFIGDNVRRILTCVPNCPQAILIITASGTDVKVLNIIPYNHSVFRIEKNIYNTILEEFHLKIIQPLLDNTSSNSTLECHYKITFPPAKYTIDELIPKSIDCFYRWAKCLGTPDAPFVHQYDLHKWFDFIISLINNNERDNLSSGDLEQWLEENKWPKEQIEETILHYEHDTELLNYERHI